jgi:hypothetical protein
MKLRQSMGELRAQAGTRRRRPWPLAQIRTPILFVGACLCAIMAGFTVGVTTGLVVMSCVLLVAEWRFDQ